MGEFEDLRIAVNRMKRFDKVKKKINEDMTVREMLSKTRKLSEFESENKETNYDQKREEEKFRDFIEELNVNVEFENLVVENDLIFWGGTVDGVIQFTYSVTPNEKTSGVKFNYLDDFSVDTPDNQEIVENIQNYYDTYFYKYWRDNVLN